jgi:hypothetical protein
MWILLEGPKMALPKNASAEINVPPQVSILSNKAAGLPDELNLR